MIAFLKSGVGQLLHSIPLAAVAFAVSGILFVHAHCQTYDMTMDVLVNSSNAAGYNPSPSSPGEYQRYLSAIWSTCRFRTA